MITYFLGWRNKTLIINILHTNTLLFAMFVKSSSEVKPNNFRQIQGVFHAKPKFLIINS